MDRRGLVCAGVVVIAVVSGTGCSSHSADDTSGSCLTSTGGLVIDNETGADQLVAIQTSKNQVEISLATGVIVSETVAAGTVTVSDAASPNKPAFQPSTVDLVCATKSHVTLIANSSYEITVALSGTGLGDVASNPAGIACGTFFSTPVCAYSFTYPGTVTLTASPNSDSTFHGWTGACNGSSTTCAVSSISSVSVGAEFDQK